MVDGRYEAEAEDGDMCNSAELVWREKYWSAWLDCHLCVSTYGFRQPTDECDKMRVRARMVGIGVRGVGM